MGIPIGAGTTGPVYHPPMPPPRPPINQPGEGRLGGPGASSSPFVPHYSDPGSAVPVANVYQPGRVNALAPLIDQYLARYNSPLRGLGNVFTKKAKKAGIDPRLLVAIAGAETSFGTYGPSQRINNPFGMGPGIEYPSWGAAIGAAAKNLGDNYFGQGLNTIPKIQGKWAPSGASNDPTDLNSNWTKNVTKFYNEIKKMKPPGGRLFPVMGPGYGWSDLGGPTGHGAKASNSMWQNNNAVDLGAPVGTPLYSVARGRINDSAGFGQFPSGNPQIFGSRFQLDAPQLGNSFYYTHLGRLAPGLSPGDRVRRGDLLGYVGEMPGGPSHLHFASQYGDPYDYLRGGRASYEGGSTGYNLTGQATQQQAQNYSNAQAMVANSGGAMLAGATSGDPETSPTGRRRKKKADESIEALIAALAAGTRGAEAMTKKGRKRAS